MKKWNLGEVYQANQPKKRDPKCSIQLLRPFDHCRYKISLFWFLLSLSHSLSLLLVRRSWFRCCFWRRKRGTTVSVLPSQRFGLSTIRKLLSFDGFDPLELGLELQWMEIIFVIGLCSSWHVHESNQISTRQLIGPTYRLLWPFWLFSKQRTLTNHFY